MAIKSSLLFIIVAEKISLYDFDKMNRFFDSKQSNLNVAKGGDQYSDAVITDQCPEGVIDGILSIIWEFNKTCYKSRHFDALATIYLHNIYTI